MHKQSQSDYRLRPMTANDLDMVLQWRNHNKIRQYMYTQHEISREEHSRWYEAVNRDNNRYQLIFESSGIATGFINFTRHGEVPVADWGFYLAPGAVKGVGHQLGRLALDFAFTDMKLHKLCGEVLASNERSIRFHLKLGFQQEGVLREQYINNQRYIDVIRFGLLIHERKLVDQQVQ